MSPVNTESESKGVAMPKLDRLDAIDAHLADIDAKIAKLYGPHIELVEKAINIEGQQVEGPHAELVAAEGPPPGQTLEDWLSSVTGSPGFVVDPGAARDTPCIKVEFETGGGALVYSKGIRGALDEEQQALYCQQGYEVRPISKEQKARAEALRTSSHVCYDETKEVPEFKERLGNYYTCIGRELRAKGVEP